MVDDNGGSVRITNAQIFDELRRTRTDVAGLKLTMEETVKPGLQEARADIRALDKAKADKAETAKLDTAITSVRNQTYAIVSGVLAALIALRTLGVI